MKNLAGNKDCDKYRVATEYEENNKVVNCYHIDSQAGLLLFATMIKNHLNGIIREYEW